MTKPKQSLIIEDTIDKVFERIGDQVAGDPYERSKIHRQTKAGILGVEATRAATDFSLEDTLTAFDLKYNLEALLTGSKSHWAIEDELQSTFPMTPCLCSHFLSYHVS
jgi:hypothetical protein